MGRICLQYPVKNSEWQKQTVNVFVIFDKDLQILLKKLHLLEPLERSLKSIVARLRKCRWQKRLNDPLVNAAVRP